MNAPHPMEQERIKRREARKAVRDLQKFATQTTTARYDLHYVHIRPKRGHRTGATVAYQFAGGANGKLLRVALALQHPHDQFCKRTGRYQASKAFSEGNHILLRRPPGIPSAAFLSETFDLTTYIV